MEKKMKILAVIPARAGSTRLKDKNIFPLLGKPLIRWITESVVESNCFQDILISTDGDHIYDAVSDLPIQRHHRPERHATTRATVLDAMIDIMESTEKEYNAFAYFLPTCPFVSSDDIIKGVDKLKNRDCDSVISMTEIPETIQLACVMSEDNVLPVFDNLECGMTNSKFIKKYHKPSGAFYMGLWNYLIENKNFFKRNVKGVIIPPKRSVDINTIEDIQYAETFRT
jgi:CMP-N-acetylneuraminic acid synthetase